MSEAMSSVCVLEDETDARADGVVAAQRDLVDNEETKPHALAAIGFRMHRESLSQSFAATKRLEVRVIELEDKQSHSRNEAHSLRQSREDAAIGNEQEAPQATSTREPSQSEVKQKMLALLEEIRSFATVSGAGTKLEAAKEAATLAASSPHSIADLVTNDVTLCESFFMPCHERSQPDGSTKRVDLITFFMSRFRSDTTEQEHRLSLLRTVLAVVRAVGLKMEHLRLLLSMLLTDGAWSEHACTLLQTLCKMVTGDEIGSGGKQSAVSDPQTPFSALGQPYFCLDGHSAGIRFCADDKTAWHTGYSCATRIWWSETPSCGPVVRMASRPVGSDGAFVQLMQAVITEKGLAVVLVNASGQQEEVEVEVKDRTSRWCSIVLSHAPPRRADQKGTLLIWIDTVLTTFNVTYPSAMQAPNSSVQPKPLNVGQDVILRGLKKQPQFNGREATIVSVVDESVSVRVTFQGASKLLRVKRSHLTPRHASPPQPAPLISVRVLAFTSAGEQEATDCDGDGVRWWKGFATEVAVWNVALASHEGVLPVMSPQQVPSPRFCARPEQMHSGAGAWFGDSAQGIGNLCVGGHFRVSKVWLVRGRDCLPAGTRCVCSERVCRGVCVCVFACVRACKCRAQLRPMRWPFRG
jgi:hypothetical protein